MKLTKITSFYQRTATSTTARVVAGLIACGAVASLSGCAAANSLMGGNSRKEAVAEISWDFAENGVLIEIEADPRLNQYDGEAHTLLLGVYQMEDSAAFYKLAADPALLGKALETGKGGDAFVQFVRYVVTPGQRIIFAMDRAQKAKFVGISAGYYQMDAAKSTRLFQIPLTVESDGMVTTTWKAAPATLALRLNLGADGVVNAQRLNHDPAAKPKLEAVPLDGGGKELKLTVEDAKNAINMGSALRKLDK
ncbi:MAG: type VI secretion system lipoprotein TssJ [Pseudomonadota bacterium]